MPEQSYRELEMVRAAVVSPEHRVGDVAGNVAETLAQARACAEQGAHLIVFPELGLTSYSCADLFYQRVLLQAARRGLAEIVAASEEIEAVLVVGLPWEADGRLFNCAAVICGGELLGLVPKNYMPTYGEFYEERWFARAEEAVSDVVEWEGEEIPFGDDLLFQAEDWPGFTLGVEICEDVWAPEPASGKMALAGATVLANLSASPELLGKHPYRRALVEQQSARCLAAYLLAGAGPGESTTDVVYSGDRLIAENGQTLAMAERFHFESGHNLADLDIAKLLHERLRNTTFSTEEPGRDYRQIQFTLTSLERPLSPSALVRPVPRTPFVPGDLERRAEHCAEIFAIQATGLARRLRHIGNVKTVIGLSGGLDSTLALLVTIRAFDKLKRPHKDIVAITMPGFGTTKRTKTNAVALAEELGVTLREISIDAAVRQHFADIGHDEQTHDVTYENSQARERTQILMDVANQVGGIVIGTGDMSELAMGWCTYNGDHMSMYAVNCSVPKTLVRYLVDYVADAEFSGKASQILHDIADTPISPELLPPDEAGDIAQKTEQSIGPYELHDFFLFHCVRHGVPPRKLLFLAENAFAGHYTPDELRDWLKVFYKRFFNNQFKRSAIPDGPKVGTVALSPRGDWRMPSDATARLWLDELE